MLRGSSSQFILFILVLVSLIAVFPAGAANTTVETTVAAVPTTEAANQSPVTTTLTTVPPTTVVAANQTTVAPATTVATTLTTAPPTQTTANATLTTVVPATPTIPASLPATVVSTAVPATPFPTVTTGIVNIHSSPPGASILIDGNYLGVTPKTVDGVPAGNHILRLTMSGYTDYEGSIYVVAGQVAQGYGTLQPLGQAITPAPVTTLVVPVVVPVVAATPPPTQDAGPLANSSVVAAIIGAIGVIVVSAASVYTHVRPPKKE
jgi:hypothetical protein